MQTSAMFVVAMLLLAPLVLAGTLPVGQPWVDPNAVQGRLLVSVDVKVGTGVAIWGDVSDPDGDPVTVTLQRPGGEFRADPNGAYTWQWFPPVSALGVHYLVLTVSEDPATAVGPVLTDVGTMAVRVLPANRPPVIHHGGCRVFH